ncbi:ABC transporter permease [Halarchaeum nitratireducens]|uniref:ABC transporter permease n=1 Tax=Halarchaeum nitratireducens TaxID=489913 RepID=A0A830G7U3_9EURY|nr:MULTISPECIES: ABC transporter permease [Halarchaeum]MBP2249978.1 peptide/nickel transport system permease protein [Halarchaeum solikamskense]GGN09329.1 ABC transporter permease [Halarchaeum nitratireducens]
MQINDSSGSTDSGLLGALRPGRLRDHYLFRNLRSSLRLYLSDRLTVVFLAGFVLVLLAAVFGPMIAPYPPDKVFITSSGEILKLAHPSGEHLLGTTARGQDVFSRLLIGARPTLFTGLLGGFLVVLIGVTIGVSAGYYGGRVDDVLMRLTDFVFGIPLIPTAIVLAAYFGVGTWSTILVIGCLLWRNNARVFRSQVLQIREREHVRAAQMLGASDRYVITRHILPNLGGMIVLFFALGTGLTIIISASLSFLGFADLSLPSWGLMLRNAYNSGYMASAWWWSLTSGFAISLTVLCIFMLGRGYERVHETNVSEF